LDEYQDHQEDIRADYPVRQEANGTILKKHYKSPFPALSNVQRCDESVAMDTVYSDTPAIEGGETCAQIVVGTETLVTDVYGMKTEKQFVNTLEDNIRERGAMSQLLSDRAQVEISARVVGILRALHIGQWQSEPHQQHQNPCERRYQTLKTTTNTLLDRSGSPGYTLSYVCCGSSELDLQLDTWWHTTTVC
jgi:hypothetical protein